MFTKGLLQNLQFYVRPANPLTMEDAINVARSFEDSYKSVNIQPAVPMNHFTQPPVFQQSIPDPVAQDITKVLKDLSDQIAQMKRANTSNQRNGSTDRRPNNNFQPRREFQNNNYSRPPPPREWQNSRPATRQIVCYNCEQEGHISTRCPNLSQ